MSDQTLFCGFGLIGDSLEVKKNVLLTISDGIIQDIELDLPDKEGKLQYTNCVVVPGFINAHTHIGDTFAKDQGLECSIQELVEPPNGLKHQLLGKVSDEQLKFGFKYAIQEMIASGTTTFIDFRESGEKGINIIKEIIEKSHINAKICGRPFPNLEALPKVLEKSDGLGLSSSNIYTENDLNYIKNLCKTNQKLILTHASETKEERTYALNKFEMSDIKRSVFVLDVDILVHVTWANEEDIQIIAEEEKSVVICPRSNSHLGIGYPPLNLLKKYNILTCLGTDNVMINNLNLFREMEFLFKSAREKFGIHIISSYEILKMVTINPAKAFKLDNEIGSIKKGKRADFFLINLKTPNMELFTSIYDVLVLRANPQNIRGVYIGGDLVYDGESEIEK